MKYKFLFFILFCALCGCATPTPPPLSLLSWAERKQQLEKVTHWDLEGAIAIHSTTGSGTASLLWKQDQQHYALSLFGPLGANAVQITGQPGRVTLKTAEDKEFSAATPERLLYNQMGWNFPVSALHYWIRGLPLPGTPAEKTFDRYQRLHQLRQEHWEITFNDYAVFNGIELPTRLLLMHPPLNIKIVIYRWGNV